MNGARIGLQAVLNPHRRTMVVLVLDLGFRKGCAVVNAPVDRAQSFVDEVLFKELVERVDNVSLELRRHRGIGPVPAPEYAYALELLALEVEEFVRVLAAFETDLARVHLQLFATEHLVNLDLDGQPVTVP